MSTCQIPANGVVRGDISAWQFAGMAMTALDGQSERPGAGAIPTVQSLPLVVEAPGWVQFADRYYCLEREGLYRFWHWGRVRDAGAGDLPEIVDEERDFASVICYRDDLRTLLASLMLVHVHGYAHERLPFDDQLRHAQAGHLSLTCGFIAHFACRLLESVGIRARRVSGLRLEGPYNTYDNGHTLNEVYWPALDKWVLVDVDLHQLFLDREGGTCLSLAEVSARIGRGEEFALQSLTPPGMGGIDVTESVRGDFCAQLLLEGAFFHPEVMKAWFRRSLAAPLIVDGNSAYFYCDDARARERVARYSPYYHPLPKDEWMRRFYAGEGDADAPR